MVALSIVLTFLIFCLIYTAAEPPLCGICNCKFIDSYYNIECSTNVEQYIFDSSYWNDLNNKKYYPYRSLAVQNNSIYRLDRQFPRSSLISLSLESCSIDYISDSAFSNLQFLKKLVLSHNVIERFHPKAFMGHYRKNEHPSLPLKKLLLDHNRIDSLSEGLFQYTRDIEVLSLAHNPLSLDTQTVKALNGLAFLKKLDLSYTELSSLPGAFLRSHRNIRNLDLSGNQFLNVPSRLGNLVTLKVLHFSNNPLVDLDSSFPKIPELDTLYMCNMPHLLQIGPKSLGQLRNLETLHVCNNTQLSKIHEDAFLDHGKYSHFWPPIRKLYLNNNKLRSLDVGLLEWDDLKELDMTNNPWNCVCENRWMIEDLLENVLLKIDKVQAEVLTCDTPNSLEKQRFFDIYKEGKMKSCWTAHKYLFQFQHDLNYNIALYVSYFSSLLIVVITVLCFLYIRRRTN